MVDLLNGKFLWVVFNIRVIGFYIQKKILGRLGFISKKKTKKHVQQIPDSSARSF